MILLSSTPFKIQRMARVDFFVGKGQTNRIWDIATYILNWPRGRLSGNTLLWELFYSMSPNATQLRCETVSHGHPPQDFKEINLGPRSLGLVVLTFMKNEKINKTLICQNQKQDNLTMQHILA